MLNDIEKYAIRLERPTSWCVRLAWSLAASEIERFTSDDGTVNSRLFNGNREPQPMALPSRTWRTIRHEAARLDRSPSWIVQQAWRIARPYFPETARLETAQP
jgi:uncharacterized small protein (TIGR04563 family)